MYAIEIRFIAMHAFFNRLHSEVPDSPPGSNPGLPVAASDHLHASAADAARLMKALANPDRLLLLCQLVLAERSVSELGATSGMTQPSLSQQLAVLRGERLVATRRAGKSVIYRISSPAALAILQTLFALFCAEPAAAAADKAPTPARQTVRRRLEKLS